LLLVLPLNTYRGLYITLLSKHSSQRENLTVFLTPGFTAILKTEAAALIKNHIAKGIERTNEQFHNHTFLCQKAAILSYSALALRNHQTVLKNPGVLRFRQSLSASFTD